MLVTSKQQKCEMLKRPQMDMKFLLSLMHYLGVLYEGSSIFTQIRRGWLPRWSMYWLNMSSSTEQSPGAEAAAFCRSSSTTKSIIGKSLTLSIEPPVTDVNVLVEQCTTWSEEAVLGHTYIFISCANMKCLAFSSFSCAKAIESVYTGWWGNRWLQLVELEKFWLAEKVVGRERI